MSEIDADINAVMVRVGKDMDTLRRLLEIRQLVEKFRSGRDPQFTIDCASVVLTGNMLSATVGDA